MEAREGAKMTADELRELHVEQWGEKLEWAPLDFFQVRGTGKQSGPGVVFSINEALGQATVFFEKLGPTKMTCAGLQFLRPLEGEPSRALNACFQAARMTRQRLKRKE